MSLTVTVREVNQNTAEVLQRVQSGEEIVVTNHGRPSARIVPFTPRNTYERWLSEGRLVSASADRIRIDQTFSLGRPVDEFLCEERADRTLP
jgi:prevent-host-death family protein